MVVETILANMVAAVSANEPAQILRRSLRGPVIGEVRLTTV
jgi:hypothetical protein